MVIRDKTKKKAVDFMPLWWLLLIFIQSTNCTLWPSWKGCRKVKTPQNILEEPSSGGHYWLLLRLKCLPQCFGKHKGKWVLRARLQLWKALTDDEHSLLLLPWASHFMGTYVYHFIQFPCKEYNTFNTEVNICGSVKTLLANNVDLS